MSAVQWLSDRLDPYNSSEWRGRRRAFLDRYGRVCAVGDGRCVRELHVHHLRYPPRWLRWIWPLWRVPDRWLMVLCEYHHNLIPCGRRLRRLSLTHLSATRRVLGRRVMRRWRIRTGLRAFSPSLSATVLLLTVVLYILLRVA